MRITTTVPQPPPEFTMTFSRNEGWAIVAALLEYAAKNPSAVQVEEWRAWANSLDEKLRP